MPICEVCHHHCNLEEGMLGICRARICLNGVIQCANYGHITALALDPIEKKPLRNFYPGSYILSVGSYGCNLRCPFCQNNEISYGFGMNAYSSGGFPEMRPDVPYRELSPKNLVEMALECRKAEDSGYPEDAGRTVTKTKVGAGSFDDSAGTTRSREGADGLHGDIAGRDCRSGRGPSYTDDYDRRNLGIAFTYNEPLVGYEFVRDTAWLAHENGLKNVLVSNGNASLEVCREILPYIDAMNIDLKGFTDAYYSDVLKGDRRMVMEFIEEAAKSCHVEVTTLIVPGYNDSEQEIRELAKWLDGLDTAAGGSTSVEGAATGNSKAGIPLHISRYFPRFRMTDVPATDVSLIYELADVARDYLEFVYTGNC